MKIEVAAVLCLFLLRPIVEHIPRLFFMRLAFGSYHREAVPRLPAMLLLYIFLAAPYAFQARQLAGIES